MLNWQRAGFGLYVHWPFCEAKCPYCDFNSHVVANVDQSRWADALTSEIERYARETSGRRLSSIFFGGGTPSLMDGATVERVIETAAKVWTFADDIEITLEANPTSAEADRFAAYGKAGVTRVSIGVQALNDADLRALGRRHSAEDALRTIEMARETFDRVSFDLIYARQNQTLEAWEAELTAALQMHPDHLSLYQLTIEPETAFGRRFEAGKLSGLPDNDRAADMYELTQALCESAGLPAYEISNHAKPDAESIHNLIYWNSGDWIGVGPGAHGRFETREGRVATEGISAPGAWLSAVGSSTPEASREVITADDARSDALMMGLRLRDGISTDNPAFPSAREKVREINYLSEIGLLSANAERVRATAQGRLALNYVVQELLD